MENMFLDDLKEPSTREMGPEEIKWRTRLRIKLNEGMQNFHFDWTAEGWALPFEEKCKQMNLAWDEIDKWDELSLEDQMKEQIAQAYEDLEQGIRFTQFSVDTWTKKEITLEDYQLMLKRMSNIFLCIESAQMLLGNYVSNDRRGEIMKVAREKVKNKYEEWKERK